MINKITKILFKSVSNNLFLLFSFLSLFISLFFMINKNMIFISFIIPILFVIFNLFLLIMIISVRITYFYFSDKDKAKKLNTPMKSVTVKQVARLMNIPVHEALFILELSFLSGSATKKTKNGNVFNTVYFF